MSITETTYTLEDLRSAERETLEKIFATLRAPRPEEMDGDFVSALPAYSEETWRASMAAMGRDFWLGKSYKPEAWKTFGGHGHNRYEQKDGTVMRSSRFAWNIEPSTIDGNQSLVMYYAPFGQWGLEVDLIDEVRVAGHDLFLGLYHTKEPVPGFTPRAGEDRSEVEYFILQGPIAAYEPAQTD